MAASFGFQPTNRRQSMSSNHLKTALMEKEQASAQSSKEYSTAAGSASSSDAFYANNEQKQSDRDLLFDGTIVPDVLRDTAQRASLTAVNRMGDALQSFEAYVMQGPEGIRVLSFTGGAITGVLTFLGCFNILGILTNPVTYFLNLCLLGFSCIVMLLEASEQWIMSYEFLRRYRTNIAENGKFLLSDAGRGLFYVYFGFSVLSLYGFFTIISLLGFYLIVMGALYLGMHNGYQVDRTTSWLVGSAREGVTTLRSKVGLKSNDVNPGGISSDDPETGGAYVRL